MTDKKQTAEEWLDSQAWAENDFCEADSVDLDDAKSACKMARAEEREKCKYDFDKMFVDAAKDAEEKGRREILEDILQHGSWLRVKVLAKKYGAKP